MIDLNGKETFDKEDAKILWNKFLALAKYNIPSSSMLTDLAIVLIVHVGGFAAGFALGLYV
jgi:hypothetical protein